MASDSNVTKYLFPYSFGRRIPRLKGYIKIHFDWITRISQICDFCTPAWSLFIVIVIITYLYYVANLTALYLQSQFTTQERAINYDRRALGKISDSMSNTSKHKA